MEMGSGAGNIEPATDIIAGHFELKSTGEIIPDPFFMPKPETAETAPAADPPIKRKRATKSATAAAPDLALLQRALGSLRDLLALVELAPDLIDAFPDDIAIARELADLDHCGGRRMSAIVIGGWGDPPVSPAHHIKMANEIAKLAPSDRRTDRIRERLHAALKASKTSAARDAIHQVLFTTRDNTLRERPSMVAQLRRLVATLPALAILALPIIAHAAPDCAADAEMVDATCYPGDLQSAINQAISSDRPLLLPRGTYPTNQTLTIDYAPTSNRGFELISHGAIIDGNAITHGPVLLITCSGGTPANPKGCFHFHQEGTLFVDGHADNRTVRVGNFDYSDAHNSMVWDHLVANNGGSGGIALSLQYVLNMSAYVVADSAGAAGIEMSSGPILDDPRCGHRRARCGDHDWTRLQFWQPP